MVTWQKEGLLVWSVIYVNSIYNNAEILLKLEARTLTAKEVICIKLYKIVTPKPKSC